MEKGLGNASLLLLVLCVSVCVCVCTCACTKEQRVRDSKLLLPPKHKGLTFFLNKEFINFILR